MLLTDPIHLEMFQSTKINAINNYLPNAYKVSQKRNRIASMHISDMKYVNTIFNKNGELEYLM